MRVPESSLHRMDAAIAHQSPLRFNGALANASHATGRVVDLARSRPADAAAPERCCEIRLILRGHCRLLLAGHVRPLGAGHVVLHADDAPDVTDCSDDFDSLVVRLPLKTVDEVCVEHDWIKPERGAAFGSSPLRLEELQRFMQLCDLVWRELEADSAPSEVLHHYARLLACKLIAALDHGILHHEPDAQARCFARVVKYIDDNIRHEITAERLAQHAGLSVRSLYMLFEKQAGMTPKACIRKAKLEQVYVTLMDPASRVANVTAVALEFGFTHLGRFAELYRQTFGILPSTSLRARQGHDRAD